MSQLQIAHYDIRFHPASREHQYICLQISVNISTTKKQWLSTCQTFALLQPAHNCIELPLIFQRTTMTGGDWPMAKKVWGLAVNCTNFSFGHQGSSGPATPVLDFKCNLASLLAFLCRLLNIEWYQWLLGLIDSWIYPSLDSCAQVYLNLAHKSEGFGCYSMF